MSEEWFREFPQVHLQAPPNGVGVMRGDVKLASIKRCLGRGEGGREGGGRRKERGNRRKCAGTVKAMIW